MPLLPAFVSFVFALFCVASTQVAVHADMQGLPLIGRTLPSTALRLFVFRSQKIFHTIFKKDLFTLTSSHPTGAHHGLVITQASCHCSRQAARLLPDGSPSIPNGHPPSGISLHHGVYLHVFVLVCLCSCMTSGQHRNVCIVKYVPMLARPSSIGLALYRHSACRMPIKYLLMPLIVYAPLLVPLTPKPLSLLPTGLLHAPCTPAVQRHP